MAVSTRVPKAVSVMNMVYFYLNLFCLTKKILPLLTLRRFLKYFHPKTSPGDVLN